jgi:CysZ protein
MFFCDSGLETLNPFSSFFIISLPRGKVMGFLNGLLFNLRGLKLGLRTGKLLFWGLVRFLLLVLIMAVLTGLILAYHQDLMRLLWAKPESRWLIWLWHVVSWLASLFLIGLSAIASFIVSQVFFSALVMDHMARITELRTTGAVREPEKLPLWKLFATLILQEIPRSLIPLIVSLLILVFGWITPLGPVLTILSSAIAIVFLSWDNTDLIPARNLVPFKKRFGFLMKTIPFHLGFGLPFLVPILNILFLSFAPVGATLYYLEKQGAVEKEKKNIAKGG